MQVHTDGLTPNALPSTTRHVPTQGSDLIQDGGPTVEARPDRSTLGVVDGKEENVCTPSTLPATQEDEPYQPSLWGRVERFVWNVRAAISAERLVLPYFNWSLYDCIKRGDHDTAKARLAHPNAQKSLRAIGIFFLAVAAERRDYQMFQLFYEKGAGHAKDRQHRELLYLKAREDLGMLEMLLQTNLGPKGGELYEWDPSMAEPPYTADKFFPLAAAGKQGGLDFSLDLRGRGGSHVNPDILKATLRIAAAHGHAQLRNVLQFVLYGHYRDPKNDPEVAAYIASFLDSRDPLGNTALMLAASHGQHEAVRELQSFKANEALTNSEGKNAFQLARESTAPNKNEVMRILGGGDHAGLVRGSSEPPAQNNELLIAARPTPPSHDGDDLLRQSQAP